jgi:hypothetical protein
MKNHQPLTRGPLRFMTLVESDGKYRSMYGGGGGGGGGVMMTRTHQKIPPQAWSTATTWQVGLGHCWTHKQNSLSNPNTDFRFISQKSYPLRRGTVDAGRFWFTAALCGGGGSLREAGPALALQTVGRWPGAIIQIKLCLCEWLVLRPWQ